MTQDQGASADADRAVAASPSSPSVSPVPASIPSAIFSDAMTVFIGASRQLWRATMIENRCTSTRCADIEDENCECMREFKLYAAAAFAVPEFVLEDDDAARGMSPGTAETAQQAPGEAGQPGADRHAPNPSPETNQ